MSSDTNTRLLGLLHGDLQGLNTGEPISPPIVTTAKYKLPGIPDTPYIYGRYANPTVEAVEASLTAVEDAPAAAFPSGMAAVTAALMCAAKPGMRALLPSDGYFTVRVLAEKLLLERGVIVDHRATRGFEAADLSGFDLVWIETPSNPRLDVCDIAAIAEKTRAAGATLIADNTTLTPLLQPVLDLGVDIAVCSDTKAMSGHSDLTFGHVASRDGAFIDAVKEWRKVSGAMPGPFESFLVHRGLMTLELRLERMCQTASKAARLFEDHKVVQAVRYPGMKGDPSFKLSNRQAERPGFLIGLEFANEQIADRFVDGCRVIFPATSFGGVHTSAERRARWSDDVSEGFVRLSIGCEPAELLLSEFKDTLDAL